MALKRLSRKELFAVGTWNGRKFTESDLDGMVSAFNALNLSGRVPLKLGHEGPDVRDDPKTQYALGWVNSIWREGDILFGNLDVPERVATAIDDEFLKHVSVELLTNVKAGTRVIPWVLDSVALLGADQPAVGVLKTLQSLTMSRSRSFEHGERLAFSRQESSTENQSMTPEEEKRFKAMEDRLAKFETDNKAEKDRADKAEAEAAKTKAGARRDAIKAKFNAAVEKKTILPRSLEKFSKLYQLDDDAKVGNITDGDVESFISERAEVDAAEIKKNDTGGAKDDKGDDKETFKDKKNVEVFCAKVDKKLSTAGFARQGEAPWQTRERAGVEVMREDPKLARAYLDQPEAQYETA